MIDIFPSNSKYPVRIDLDDDLISSISIFDTDTQKTLRKINSFIVRPSRGFVLNINSIKIFKKIGVLGLKTMVRFLKASAKENLYQE